MKVKNDNIVCTNPKDIKMISLYKYIRRSILNVIKYFINRCNMFKRPDRKKRIFKVLFVLKGRNTSYGISYGLMNSANLVSEALNKRVSNVDSKVVSVIDDNGIDKEIHNCKPDVVIIEAIWVRPSKVEELSKKYPNVKFDIRVHSNLPFLAHEGMAIGWLRQYSNIGKNVTLSVNDIRMVEDLDIALNKRIKYTPNIYFPKYKLPRKQKNFSDTIHIACPGAVRPFKNHLMQTVAAIKFANRINKKLKFYINATRTEQKGDEVVKNLRALFDQNSKHQLVELSWLSHEDFLKFLKSIDLVCSVSFSETFSIVAGDAIVTGTPLIASDEVYWLNSRSWAKPTNTNDIAKGMYNAYRDDDLKQINYNRLKEFSKKSLNHWIKFLSQILSK